MFKIYLKTSHSKNIPCNANVKLPASKACLRQKEDRETTKDSGYLVLYFRILLVADKMFHTCISHRVNWNAKGTLSFASEICLLVRKLVWKLLASGNINWWKIHAQFCLSIYIVLSAIFCIHFRHSKLSTFTLKRFLIIIVDISWDFGLIIFKSMSIISQTWLPAIIIYSPTSQGCSTKRDFVPMKKWHQPCFCMEGISDYPVS